MDYAKSIGWHLLSWDSRMKGQSSARGSRHYEVWRGLDVRNLTPASGEAFHSLNLRPLGCKGEISLHQDSPSDSIIQNPSKYSVLSRCIFLDVFVSS